MDEIRTLTDSPFHGEGYRKVWARLRHKGVRTSKERVHRLMRENSLSADTGRATPRGRRAHDGTIIPETVDTMWGSDMKAEVTTVHGQVAVWRIAQNRTYHPKDCTISAKVCVLSKQTDPLG